MPATRNMPGHFSHHVDTRAGIVPHLLSWSKPCDPSNVLYTSQPSTSYRTPVLADGRRVYNEKTKRIKRPRNAFIFFRSHVNSLPDTDWKSDQNGLSRRAAEIWAQMNMEEKRPFFKMAEDESMWYAENFPDYAFKDNMNKQRASKKSRKTASQKKRAKVEVEIVVTKLESKSPSVETTSYWSPEFTIPTPSNSPLALPPLVLESCDLPLAESSSCATSTKSSSPQPSKTIAQDEIDFLSEWTTLWDNSADSQTFQPPPIDFQLETPQFYSPPTPCNLSIPFQFDTHYTSFSSEFAPSESQTSLPSLLDEPHASSFPYDLPRQHYPLYSPPLFEQ